MKLIDLLKLMTKNKKMPKKIMYQGEEYEWNYLIRDYQHNDKFLFMDLFKTCDYDLNAIANEL